MNRKQKSCVIGPVVVLAACMATAGMTTACGQNYSDKPAAGALTERNLTPLAAPAATPGASRAPIVPAAPAYGVTSSEAGTQWGDIVVQVPDGWQAEEPSSSMRLAQYAIPASHGSASLAVFPGPMGSIDDNINRWIGQFSQPDGGDSATSARRWSLSTDAGIDATLVDVAGTFNGGMGMGAGGPVEGQRMLGAIVEKGSTVLYLKLTGSAADVEDLLQPFEELVRSMRGS